MSEIKDFSEKIIEGRRKAVIRIKKGEEKRKIVETYVKKILKIFELSNEEEKSTVLIWQIKLIRKEEENDIIIMISLENEEDSKFYNELLFNEEITEDGMILGNNRKTKEALRTLRVPNAIFDDIYDYFVTDSYLLKFFEVQKTSKNVMIITIRKSAIWEIEEPKE